jgi:uncharacterized protein YecE (DUF72 family)
VASHFVGTSGWSYPHWRGLFYPKGTKSTEQIAYYAKHYRTVELNSSFYYLPREAVLASWVEKTPADFLFSVKAWRLLTHYKRLSDCEEGLATFFDRISTLEKKCGPVLFQLPPRFKPDGKRLEAFLDLLPRDRRYAFEFRDARWHQAEIYALLQKRNVAFCPFELRSLRSPRIRTADFIYVRLHGRKGAYVGNYSKTALDDWARWLGGEMHTGADVYVYFDNTDEVDYALKNANRLDELLARV